MKNWKWIVGVGVAVVAVVVMGAVAFLPRVEAAVEQVAATSARSTSTVVSPVFLGQRHGGSFGYGGPLGQDDSYLADALGITVEELQAAKDEALAAGLAQAVEAGLITQEQADAMIAGDAWFGRGGFGHHGFGGFGLTIDHQALLADALGITVEELDAARQEAHVAAVEAALADGTITQEQADLMLAVSAVKAAVDQAELRASVLGLTVEELEAAVADGTTFSELLDQAGLTATEYRDAMDEAYQAAVAQAVEDGLITQEQADLALESGFGLGGCPGGHGGMGFGRGGGFRGEFAPFSTSLDA
ncbi:MAG: hypothetical protein AB1791_07835 [Chloroflexota bacterium]